MKIIKIAAGMPKDIVDFPPERYPDSHTQYVASIRLTNQTSNHNKEYIFRIFKYPDGGFSLIGWSGGIGGYLTPHPKYFGNNQPYAAGLMSNAQYFLTSPQKGYKLIGKDYFGSRVPGVWKNDTNLSKPTPPVKPKQEWYTVDIAKKTKDPKILTDILQRGKNDGVSWNASQNPNCPPEALKEVLQRGNNDGVSHNAASNPNCPPEALKEVLQRGKNDGVSRYAALNLKKRGIKWNKEENTIPEDPKIPEVSKSSEIPKHLQDYYEAIKDQPQGEIPEGLEDLLGSNKKTTKYSIKDNTDWYEDLSDDVSESIQGYFTFISKNENGAKPYHIWWKGMNENIRIIKHDMPSEEFEKRKIEVLRIAREESLKVYKESMRAGLET